MSILIQGMDMPLRCFNCPFETYYHGKNRCLANRGKTIEWEIGHDRGRNCPLVPLPEWHGRLGDLDALQEEIKKSHDGKRLMLIDTSPTIVPADVTDINVGNKAEGGNADG